MYFHIYCTIVRSSNNHQPSVSRLNNAFKQLTNDRLQQHNQQFNQYNHNNNNKQFDNTSLCSGFSGMSKGTQQVETFSYKEEKDDSSGNEWLSSDDHNDDDNNHM